MATHLKIVAQQTKRDCSVACMAMLFGLDYDKVLAAFKHNVAGHGASTPQILKAASALGHPLVWKRKSIDVETVTGILCIRSAMWQTQHLVLAKEGQIIDADTPVSLWDADVFMSAYNAAVVGIFVEGE
jgi:ABC-type bacteriocin/lantibiotic exporter with double-glycine peptidase domain